MMAGSSRDHSYNSPTSSDTRPGVTPNPQKSGLWPPITLPQPASHRKEAYFAKRGGPMVAKQLRAPQHRRSARVGGDGPHAQASLRAQGSERLAYADWALPIGHGQTISQPYIVALMTQAARPTATSRALEIGTGCGYQTAI